MAQPWAVQCTLRGHSGEVYTCAFSPDGSTVLSGSWDNTLKLWDVGSGHRGLVRDPAFSPGGSTVLLRVNRSF